VGLPGELPLDATLTAALGLRKRRGVPTPRPAVEQEPERSGQLMPQQKEPASGPPATIAIEPH